MIEKRVRPANWRQMLRASASDEPLLLRIVEPHKIFLRTATFAAGHNNFQMSYSGGDGNDLTLTVVS